MNLRALRLVARKADLALRLLCQCLVLRNMDLVARRTAYVVARMHAACPVAALAAVVTIEAGAALYLGRRLVESTEYEVRGRALDRVISVAHMAAAGAMACLTSRLSGDTVTRLVNGKDRLFFGRAVAACADRIAACTFLKYARCIVGTNIGRHQCATEQHEADH